VERPSHGIAVSLASLSPYHVFASEELHRPGIGEELYDASLSLTPCLTATHHEEVLALKGILVDTITEVVPYFLVDRQAFKEAVMKKTWFLDLTRRIVLRKCTRGWTFRTGKARVACQ
jgi:hypothetical protein